MWVSFVYYVKPFGPAVFSRSGSSICAQSLHHQCRTTRDRPIRSGTSRSSDTRWDLPLSDTRHVLLNGKTNVTFHRFLLCWAYCVVLSHNYSVYLFVSRSSSNASPVLWCDPLGGLSSQPFPAAGCCSQQFSQSAGSKPGPAEPTAGQLATGHKADTLTPWIRRFLPELVSHAS